MGKLIDLTGQKFGRLSVLRRAPNLPNVSNSQWLCRCKCKRETVVSSNSLRRKLTRSCGCFAAECRINPKLKSRLHGAARHGKRTPEYISWVAMSQRCSNPKRESYRNYGNRGITVCERWKGPHGFQNFLADMGPRPRGRTLERMEVNGNYEPGNCKWATAKEQANNRRQLKRAA
jgi:hypothetical protein